MVVAGRRGGPGQWNGPDPHYTGQVSAIRSQPSSIHLKAETSTWSVPVPSTALEEKQADRKFRPSSGKFEGSLSYMRHSLKRENK